MRRLVFISLEFSAGTFSGNGVYARSQVRSLCQQQCDLLVISGKPPGYSAPDQTEGAQQLIQVQLPIWDRLDQGSGWAELAKQAAAPEVVQQVAAFHPDAILGVDWSSLPAYKALAAAFTAHKLTVPPYIYMNYRVYLRTCLTEDQDFMHGMESEAAAAAARVVALSRSDADFITQHLLPPTASVPVTVLLPALRSDMASLPLPCDRLQPAATPHLDHDDQRSQDVHSQPLRANKTCTSQHADCSSTAGQYIAGHATSCMAASETEERNHLSSQLPAASKSDLMPTAGPASTSASEANSEALSASADDTPIQPRNKQTAVGTRISPNIGRRTTAFSCSEPDHQSVASSQQVTSSPAAEAGSPDSTVMHDAGIDSSPSMASESAAPIMGSQQAAPPMHDWLPVTMLDSQQNASAGHDQHSTPLVGSEQEIAMQSAHQRPNGSLVGAYLGSCIAYQERLDGLGWRSYLTCCVRLSVEKEPHRFVELVEELARQGLLHTLGIVPLMCASATTPYAVDLVTRLRAAAPSAVVHTHFLGPSQLAQGALPVHGNSRKAYINSFTAGLSSQIYSKARLNIHPCLYDAYGMTIVEAASQGAPSLVNGGGAVGASDLLEAPSELFETDLSLPVSHLAEKVTELWQSSSRLMQVGQAAAVKARSWTEGANAAALLSFVERVINHSCHDS